MRPRAACVAVSLCLAILARSGLAHADPAPSQVADPIRALVVKVQSAELGFGLIVGERNGLLYIVTANHLVEAAGSRRTAATVRFASAQNADVPAKVLSRHSKELDVSILTVERGAVGLTKACTAPRLRVYPGTPLWIIGTPRAHEVVDPWRGDAHGGSVDHASDDVVLGIGIGSAAEGISGGPVFGRWGVIGIASTMSRQYVVATPILAIKAFLGPDVPFDRLEVCDSTLADDGPIALRACLDRRSPACFLRIALAHAPANTATPLGTIAVSAARHGASDLAQHAAHAIADRDARALAIASVATQLATGQQDVAELISEATAATVAPPTAVRVKAILVGAASDKRRAVEEAAERARNVDAHDRPALLVVAALAAAQFGVDEHVRPLMLEAKSTLDQIRPEQMQREADDRLRKAVFAAFARDSVFGSHARLANTLGALQVLERSSLVAESAIYFCTNRGRRLADCLSSFEAVDLVDTKCPKQARPCLGIEVVRHVVSYFNREQYLRPYVARLTEGASPQTLATLANELLKEDRERRLSGVAAPVVQRMTELSKGAKAHKPKELLKLYDLQIKAQMLDDAAETLARVLESMLLPELQIWFLNAFVSETVWDKQAEVIPRLKSRLPKDVALTEVVEPLLTLADGLQAAGRGSDGRRVLKLASDVHANAARTHVLASHVKPLIEMVAQTSGIPKLEGALALYRAMAPELFADLDRIESARRLARLEFMFADVEAGQKYVDADPLFQRYGWPMFNDLADAKTLGLLRRQDVPAARTLLRDVRYRDWATVSWRRQEVERRLLEGAVDVGQSELALRTLRELTKEDSAVLAPTVANHAAKRGAYPVARAIADDVKAQRREVAAQIYVAIADDLVRKGFRLEALRELQRPDALPAANTHEEQARDTRLEFMTRAWIEEGQLRPALEALGEVRSAGVRVRLLLDFAAALDR